MYVHRARLLTHSPTITRANLYLVGQLVISKSQGTTLGGLFSSLNLNLSTFTISSLDVRVRRARTLLLDCLLARSLIVMMVVVALRRPTTPSIASTTLTPSTTRLAGASFVMCSSRYVASEISTSTPWHCATLARYSSINARVASS